MILHQQGKAGQTIPRPAHEPSAILYLGNVPVSERLISRQVAQIQPNPLVSGTIQSGAALAGRRTGLRISISRPAPVPAASSRFIGLSEAFCSGAQPVSKRPPPPPGLRAPPSVNTG